MRPALCALVFAACGPSTGPAFDHVSAQRAPVGVELEVLLHARSPDGSAVRIDFDSPDLVDLKKRMLPASVTNYADGLAAFRWTPLAGDVGPHEIDFTASSSSVETRAPVAVEVTAGTGGAPVFREPAGEGTTLDLGRAICADVDVIVEAPDQPSVDLTLGGPPIANAKLDVTGPLAGRLSFCPSGTQVAGATIYVFDLEALAGGLSTSKTYTVVVQPARMLHCSTQPPTAKVMPLADITTTGGLHVRTLATDDIGVTSARVLWTTQPPTDALHPDLSTFTTAVAQRVAGDARSGTWEAVIPNPVVASPSGATTRVYYLGAASDSDPPLGCGRETFDPPTGMGTYQFVVKRP